MDEQDWAIGRRSIIVDVGSGSWKGYGQRNQGRDNGIGIMAGNFGRDIGIHVRAGNHGSCIARAMGQRIKGQSDPCPYKFLLTLNQETRHPKPDTLF